MSTVDVGGTVNAVLRLASEHVPDCVFSARARLDGGGCELFVTHEGREFTRGLGYGASCDRDATLSTLADLIREAHDHFATPSHWMAL